MATKVSPDTTFSIGASTQAKADVLLGNITITMCRFVRDEHKGAEGGEDVGAEVNLLPFNHLIGSQRARPRVGNKIEAVADVEHQVR